MKGPSRQPDLPEWFVDLLIGFGAALAFVIFVNIFFAHH